jgi:hypothetical protein
MRAGLSKDRSRRRQLEPSRRSHLPMVGYGSDGRRPLVRRLDSGSGGPYLNGNHVVWSRPSRGSPRLVAAIAATDLHPKATPLPAAVGHPNIGIFAGAIKSWQAPSSASGDAGRTNWSIPRLAQSNGRHRRRSRHDI